MVAMQLQECTSFKAVAKALQGCDEHKAAKSAPCICLDMVLRAAMQELVAKRMQKMCSAKRKQVHV